MVKRGPRQGKDSHGHQSEAQNAAIPSSALPESTRTPTRSRKAQQLAAKTGPAAPLTSQPPVESVQGAGSPKRTHHLNLVLPAKSQTRRSPRDNSRGQTATESQMPARQATGVAEFGTAGEALASLPANDRYMRSSQSKDHGASAAPTEEALTMRLPGLPPLQEAFAAPGRPDASRSQHAVTSSTEGPGRSRKKARHNPATSPTAAMSTELACPPADCRPLHGLNSSDQLTSKLGASSSGRLGKGRKRNTTAPDVSGPALEAPLVQPSGLQIHHSLQAMPGPAIGLSAVEEEGAALRLNSVQQVQLAEPAKPVQPLSQQKRRTSNKPKAAEGPHVAPSCYAADAVGDGERHQPAEVAASRRKSNRAGQGKRKSGLYLDADLSDGPAEFVSLVDHAGLDPQLAAKKQSGPCKQSRGRSRGSKGAVSSTAAPGKSARRQAAPAGDGSAAQGHAAAGHTQPEGEGADLKLNVDSHTAADANPAPSQQVKLRPRAKRKAGTAVAAAGGADTESQAPEPRSGVAAGNENAAEDSKQQVEGVDLSVDTSLPKASRSRRCCQCKQVCLILW